MAPARPFSARARGPLPPAAVPSRPASARPKPPPGAPDKDRPQRPQSASRGGAKQTPSGTGASAVRALSGNAAAKQKGKVAKPKHEVDEVVAEKAPTFLKKKLATLAGPSIDVEYDQSLPSEAVALALRLDEPGRCRGLRLARGGRAGEAVTTVVMLPEGVHGRARLPSILRIGPEAAIKAEAARIEACRMCWGVMAPEIVGQAFSGLSGVLQLRLAGSRLCFPKSLSNFKDVGTIGRLFETLAHCEEDLESKIAGGLRIVDQVFQVLPLVKPRPTLLLERVDLLDVFVTLEMLVLPHDHFGPEFLDGAPATGGMEERGSLLSDGILAQDLIKLVSDACGRPQKPSHFFVDFHQRMTQNANFWKMACLYSVPEIVLHPEHMLQDGEGRCWPLAAGAAAEEAAARAPEVQTRSQRAGSDFFDPALDQGGLASPPLPAAAPPAPLPGASPGPLPPGARPAFADAALWVAHGLFLYTPIATLEDELGLRKLVTYLASMPESFDAFLPPTVPGDAGPLVRWAWAYTHQVLRCTVEGLVAEAARQGRPAERPDLQFLWAMLDATLELMISVSSRNFPGRRRLALYASIVFASRLWAATGKVPEPKWYNDIRSKVKPLEVSSRAEELARATARAYVQGVGVSEAWVPCPVTGELYTPFEDRVLVEVVPEGTQQPARKESPKGAAKAVLTLSRDDSGDLEAEDVEEGTGSKDSEEKVVPPPPPVVLSKLADVYGLLQQRRRLLVMGGPGSGRSVLLRALLAHSAQELLEQEAPCELLPLRLPVRRLAALASCGAADLLQEYISQEYSASEARTLAWETLGRPPFPSRYGHQVVAFAGALWVLGGLGEGSQLFQDVWVSRDMGRTWEEMPRPPWPPRYSFQAVACDGKIIVIAGFGDGDRRLKDAWETRDGVVWAELPLAKWAARGGHRIVAVNISLGQSPPKEHLLLLGGSAHGNQTLHDVWASDNGGFAWTELEAPPWPARHSFTAVGFQEKLIIAGGVGENSLPLQDSWMMVGQIWKPRGEKPTKVAKGQVQHDMSKWETTRWVQTSRTAPLPWSAREGHATVEFRGQLVIFGGVNRSGQVQGDAWASPDGIHWSQLPCSAWDYVAGRYGHQAISIGGRHLVVGGADAENRFLGDAVLSRRLFLAFDSLDEASAEETAVLNYMDRLLSNEPHHEVVMTTGPIGLDHLKSMHLQKWDFVEVEVKPFTDDDLRDFCGRCLAFVPPEQATTAQELFRDLQYKELARTPLLAVLLLHEFRKYGGNLVNRCEVYQSIFELCLQSLDGAKRRDNSEFRRLHAQGVDTVVAELALEVQSRGASVIKERDLVRFAVSEAPAVEALTRLGHAGQLVLFEITPEGLRFRNHSMQEFLAARQLWRRVNAGEGLPAWVVREGLGSESAVGCGRFFCTLAKNCSTLVPTDFGDLKEGFGCILRNVSRAGDPVAAQMLLNVVPNRQALLTTVDKVGALGLTALHLASGQGHHQVCRALLKLAPDASVLHGLADASGLFPLHAAASGGHEAVVRVLLQLSSDRVVLITSVDKSEQRFSALHHAARSGHHLVARALLELAPSPGALNVAVDKCGRTSLHLAAQHGHEATLRVLMSRALDRGVLAATESTHDRRTALHLASERGHQSVVRALLDLSPDRSSLLNVTDKFGQTALHVAAEKGHDATIHALLQASDEAERAVLLFARERRTGQTALHLAADAGHAGAVAALIELAPNKDALVCAVDRCRDTALHLAAEKGRAAAARTLLELTADRGQLLGKKERFAGQTALHVAASMGRVEVVRVLLDVAGPTAKALIPAPDTEGGFTPVHLAAEAGHEAVLQVLLESALDRAVVLKAGVERWSNFTPMHLVAYRGHEEAASKLLQLAPDKKAVLSAKDDRGRTPAELASTRGQREVQKLLEAAA